MFGKHYNDTEKSKEKKTLLKEEVWERRREGGRERKNNTTHTHRMNKIAEKTIETLKNTDRKLSPKNLQFFSFLISFCLSLPLSLSRSFFIFEFFNRKIFNRILILVPLALLIKSIEFYLKIKEQRETAN